MSKKLGKGLDAIFGEGLEEAIKDIERKGSVKDQVISLPLGKIEPNPFQPRRTFDKEKLVELSNSIKENGLMTPIIVKETKGGKYYIIAGERRYRATKLANKKTITAIVIKVTDKKMAELAIIENVQREDLNPIEEALAVNALITTHKMTQQSAAKVLGKSRPYVSNLLRLLKLDKNIIDGITSGKVKYGQVRPLIGLPNPEAMKIYTRILEDGLSSREVENIVIAYNLRQAKGKKKKTTSKRDPELIYAEDLIRNKVKSRVIVEEKQIIIKYKGKDQLNRILKRIDALEE